MQHNFTVLCCVHFICLSIPPSSSFSSLASTPRGWSMSSLDSHALWLPVGLPQGERGQSEIRIFILLVLPSGVASGQWCPLAKGYWASQGGFSLSFSASGYFSLPWFSGPRYSNSSTAARPNTLCSLWWFSYIRVML